MSELQSVTDATFQAEVLEADLPVLVDLTAIWCGPCKMVDPIVAELASEWEGKVKVLKLDVDHNPNTPMQYRVMGVPTLLFFRDGELKERLSGYKPKKHIISKFSPYI